MSAAVVIRAEGAQDRAGVHRMLTAAFADEPVVADLVDALRGSSAWRRGLAFVAEDAGGPVGYVLATRAWLDAPRALVEVLVLSPLGVHPDRQGRGIGSRLVRRLVDAATERPEPAIFLEGSPAYYSRFGFESAAALGMRRPSLRIPLPAFQLKRLPAYDRALSGTLVYPDAFWELDCVGLRQPQ